VRAIKTGSWWRSNPITSRSHRAINGEARAPRGSIVGQQLGEQVSGVMTRKCSSVPHLRLRVITDEDREIAKRYT
jgi:hypothetical protein